MRKDVFPYLHMQLLLSAVEHENYVINFSESNEKKILISDSFEFFIINNIIDTFYMKLIFDHLFNL